MTETNSLEHKIKLMGDAFRGLLRHPNCKDYEVTHNEESQTLSICANSYWSLTFIYKEELVETPHYLNWNKCFDFALKKVKLLNEKKNEHKINLSHSQLQLLKIIKGVFLNSLQTYPQAKDNNNKKIHKMALSLERKKLIYRHFDRENYIVWILTKEGIRLQNKYV